METSVFVCTLFQVCYYFKHLNDIYYGFISVSWRQTAADVFITEM